MGVPLGSALVEVLLDRGVHRGARVTGDRSGACREGVRGFDGQRLVSQYTAAPGPFHHHGRGRKPGPDLTCIAEESSTAMDEHPARRAPTLTAKAPSPWCRPRSKPCRSRSPSDRQGIPRYHVDAVGQTTTTRSSTSSRCSPSCSATPRRSATELAVTVDDRGPRRRPHHHQRARRAQTRPDPRLRQRPPARGATARSSMWATIESALSDCRESRDRPDQSVGCDEAKRNRTGAGYQGSRCDSAPLHRHPVR